MSDLLFWCFVALATGPLLFVLLRPEKIYQYPYFMAATFAAFILPQAISLQRFPGPAPEQAIQSVLLATCLCLACCLIGYRRHAGPPARRMLNSSFDETRLLHAGLLFVASGFYFGYRLSHMEVMTAEKGGWTGPATIYGFFQQLCYPGFAICLRVALHRPTVLSLGSTLLAAVVPVQSILFGRREAAALFAMTVGLTFYFQMRLRPPRWLVITAIAAATLAIPATSAYRQLQLQSDWAAVQQINWFENFKNFLDQESPLELRNAAMLIEATRRSGDYQMGKGYWNHLVFRYVPAQWLGQRFKDSLLVHGGTEGVERELAAMDYTNPPGSTVTGMGDSFQQFGYWGCLFFAGMALLFRTLWDAACERKALLAQLLYIQSCTCAMRALTHWTLDFLPGLLYNTIFLGIALLYASSPWTRTEASGADAIRRNRLRRPHQDAPIAEQNHEGARLQRLIRSPSPPQPLISPKPWPR